MAYIGKITITSEWAKVEDLIKAQVDGQTSFAFDSEKEYFIMADGAPSPVMFGVYVCDSSTEPSNDTEGEYLTEGLPGIYQPESGSYLWIKTRGNTTGVTVSVSNLG